MLRQQGLRLKSIVLPEWLASEVTLGQVIPDEDDRMSVAVRLSARQVEQGTGGPFGALVCELGSGKVIGFGVNQVVESSWRRKIVVAMT